MKLLGLRVANQDGKLTGIIDKLPGTSEPDLRWVRVRWDGASVSYWYPLPVAPTNSLPLLASNYHQPTLFESEVHS